MVDVVVLVVPLPRNVVPGHHGWNIVVVLLIVTEVAAINCNLQLFCKSQ